MNLKHETYMGRTLDDALAYAEKQREELPQIVQVEPHDYDRIIMAEEIARLKNLVDAAGIIFRHNLTPDKGFNYFICGEGGEKDQNNLPDQSSLQHPLLEMFHPSNFTSFHVII